MADGHEDEPLTVQVLRSIRDEIHALRRETQAELRQLRAETAGELRELRTETNGRLDHLAEGQIRIATEVVELRGSVEHQTTRFEHFIETEGNAVRDLRTRVERIEEHGGVPRPRGR